MGMTSERSLVITLSCEVDGCAGLIRFEGPVMIAGHPPRLLGHCDDCQGAFTLYGGRVEPFEGPVIDLRDQDEADDDRTVSRSDLRATPLRRRRRGR